VPVFRSIKNPVSLLELSVHDNVISAATMGLSHPAASVTRKVAIAIRFRLLIGFCIIDVSFLRAAVADKSPKIRTAI
jgi:hypothetical protein